MAASDAIPVPRKNQAFRVYLTILDADGDPVTGATGLDSEVSKDAGAFADCTNEATEIAQGMYYLDLTASEMNADAVVVIVKTSTSGAKTTPIFLYPEEAGDVRANLVQWNRTTPNNLISGRVDANAQVVGDKTGYTASTVSDKTGYSLSGAGIQAIWDALTSALTTAGSIGKKLADWVLGSDSKVILSNNAHTGATVPTVTSVTNVVKIDAAFKKNTAYSNYTFLMVDDTDGKTPETGLTGISCTRSIDGGAFASCANAATEIGNGWYKIDLVAGDLNGDEIVLRFTKSGVARNWEHKIRTNPT